MKMDARCRVFDRDVMEMMMYKKRTRPNGRRKRDVYVERTPTREVADHSLGVKGRVNANVSGRCV